MTKESPDPFQSLPDELILRFFGYCSPQQIINMMATSRRFYKIGVHLPIWRCLFKRAWKGPCPTKFEQEDGAFYRNFCKLKHLINQNWQQELTSTTSLCGHTRWVTSVVVTPNGKQIISGSYDNTVRVWDIETGKLSARLEGHTDWVNSVVVTPDGKQIISGSRDRTVRVWNIETEQLSACLGGHEDSMIRVVAVTPDGRIIILRAEDSTIGIWNIENGQETTSLRGHENAVLCVAVTPDGAKIISGSVDKTVRVWDSNTGQQLACLRRHTCCVTSVAVTPDGKKIVSASTDRTMRIWNSVTGEQIACLRADAQSVRSLVISPDGTEIILTFGNLIFGNRTIRILDIETLQEIAYLEHTKMVSSLAVTPDGRIISGSEDGTIKVHAYDAEKFERILL